MLASKRQKPEFCGDCLEPNRRIQLKWKSKVRRCFPRTHPSVSFWFSRQNGRLTHNWRY